MAKLSVHPSTQFNPSPSHTPQSSNSDVPPHTPLQSTSTKQLPSQSKFNSANTQLSSSSVAFESKLQAELSIQPKTGI